MSSYLLKGTPLETVYSLFGADGDENLCLRMSYIGILYTLVVGLYSIFQPSPYGRYAKETFGPTINAKVGWVIQECMSFVFPLLIILFTPAVQLGNQANTVAILLFMLHYFQRSFIYPVTMSSESKPAPIVIVLAATIFTSFNGFLQGHHLANVYKPNEPQLLYTSIGAAIFLVGVILNVSHDQILIALRKNASRRSSEVASSSTSQTTTKYKIPRGGLFEYVSGANYLGEIIEWIGLAVITRDYPQIIFAVFSSVFLGIRAIHHHRFYSKTFGSSYPKSRRALIPFVL